MNSKKKVSILVVGTGFGCRIQIPALRAAGFEVVGLVGTNLERTLHRAADNGVDRAFIDLAVGISETHANAVAISTPPHTHGALALTAIEHGCHVICEKPFARNVVEARCVLDAASRAGIVHILGNEFRFEPQRAAISRAIAEGMIGKPRFATFTLFSSWIIDNVQRMPEWWFNERVGGGWLGASGSHSVDWVRESLGNFESLSATTSTVSGRARGADDSFAVRFRLTNGLDGVIQQTSAAYGPASAATRIVGAEGSLWLDGAVPWIADSKGARELMIPSDLALPPSPKGSSDPRMRSQEWQIMSSLELGPYTRLCEGMLALIEGRKPTSPVSLPTFVDGVGNMAVIDAIRASAANEGELIRLNEAVPETVPVT